MNAILTIFKKGLLEDVLSPKRNVKYPKIFTGVPGQCAHYEVITPTNADPYLSRCLGNSVVHSTHGWLCEFHQNDLSTSKIPHVLSAAERDYNHVTSIIRSEQKALAQGSRSYARVGLNLGVHYWEK